MLESEGSPQPDILQFARIFFSVIHAPSSQPIDVHFVGLRIDSMRKNRLSETDVNQLFEVQHADVCIRRLQKL